MQDLAKPLKIAKRLSFYEVYTWSITFSEINIYSIVIIFVFSLMVSALASYFPAKGISKMTTFRALKYD